MSQPATYTHGHHTSALTAHSQRTAQNSCAYLLPHLKPHHKILDIGCGPATITVSLAALVPQGSVIGIDFASAIPAAQDAVSASGLTNVEVQEGDVYKLPFGDGEFDIVHMHQVLQHIHDPVGALREMRRVAKKGGIVCAREADFDLFGWFPETQEMRRWHELYKTVARTNGGEPIAGRRLHLWARQAGFAPSQITKSVGTYLFTGPEDMAWFPTSWADRMIHSNIATTAKEKGLATEEELKVISEGWRRWGREEDAWFAMVHGEILCWV
ncbi:hypothetical protein HDV00_005462 [Rhizophlyctis rosea]|nr:hypothetical protein HDV00_005462 [Rhizophlyctis rosea]